MIPQTALPWAYNPAIGGEGALFQWGAVVSTERAGSAVVVAQTGHEDFICRLFAILGFSVVCKLERFPGAPSGDR